MAAGPIGITYINLSSTTFQQSSALTGYLVQHVVASLSQTPTSTLPNGSVTTTELNENAFSDFQSGLSWISLGWTNPANGMQFGVKIYMPYQLVDIGSQPYYETTFYPKGGSPNWAKPVSNPANPYTFPTSVGFNIQVTPTASHTSLTVSVGISDLNS